MFWLDLGNIATLEIADANVSQLGVNLLQEVELELSRIKVEKRQLEKKFIKRSGGKSMVFSLNLMIIHQV